ncbi:hypothetical protein L1049_003321 [Liquidambar formosana]|uniref:DRBM domain-containing protein n=1 Tax=Liquidambar formosana TaxID=63359 RepID=A0AAP0NGJ1_LIQFO
MHKNRLQEYTQRASIPLPIYQTINEGYQHAPQFRSSVLVDGAAYTSPNTFSHRKAAEQDVAKLALECISKKIKDEGCPLIREDTVFCKSILNEFAVKMNLEKPIYNTIQSEGLLPVFISSLVFNGVTYTGVAARNKKEAEQLGARAVILSILGNSGSGTLLSEIIKSKLKLFAALHKAKGSPYIHNSVVPVGVDMGNIQNTGNTPIILPSAGKEVEIAVGTDNVPTTAFPEAGQLTNLLVTPPAFHEFKTPKSEPSAEAIPPPIVFVPSVFEQPLGVESSSGKKRNRKNKKKSNKKSRIDPQLQVAVLSVNQAPPCSVAQ